jgi:hypothetical protein
MRTLAIKLGPSLVMGKRDSLLWIVMKVVSILKKLQVAFVSLIRCLVLRGNGDGIHSQ